MKHREGSLTALLQISVGWISTGWHQYQLSPQMYSRLIIDSPLVYQDQLNDGKHKNSQHRRFIYIETLSIPMTIITVGGGNQGQYIFIQLFFGLTSNIFCLFIQLKTAAGQQQDLSSSVFTVQHFRPSACADIYVHVPFVKLQTGTAKNICKTWWFLQQQLSTHLCEMWNVLSIKITSGHLPGW